MRYIEGFHGIFRDYSGKPTLWHLKQYRKTFYDENPDALRLDKDQFTNVWSIVIAAILTIIGFAIQNENIIMLGLSSGVLVNSISYIVGYSRGHFPKAEKTRYFYPIIGLGGSIIPFVYNLLRILRIVPASFLGSDLTFALMFAWLGGSTLLMQLFYALKMNIKCREKTEGTLIGYSDYETTVSQGNHAVDKTIASKYVYSFDVDGEEYTVVTPYSAPNEFFCRPIGSTHVIKYNAENPEFCMFKHFEIGSVISGLIIALICGWVAFNGFYQVINRDINDPFGKNASQMPSIIVVDDDGNYRVPETDNESDFDAEDIVATEPSETPTPTPVPPYSDEWINECYDTDDFVCYVYPVVSIKEDKAYMGAVPGLYSRYIPSDGLEVGDEILFVNFRGTYLFHKLDEGESYTGTHTPESRGWVSEDGRLIFCEDYVNFYYGDGYEVRTYYVQGQEGDSYMIGCDEYYYLFNESDIEDFPNWNMERGHVYYGASNDITVFIVDSDLFVLP